MFTPSWNTFCDPAYGSTLRVDFGTGNADGTIFGNCSAIMGGCLTGSNANYGDVSVIVMGDSNAINTFGSPAANGCFNFIGNGHAQIIAGCNNFIGSGDSNFVSSSLGGVAYSSVVGGQENLISDNGVTPAQNSFIGGGNGNIMCGSYASIVGGQFNQSYGDCNFLGGGQSNCALGSLSVIGGGLNNASCGEYSFTGSGENNVSSDAWTVIGGGCCNIMYHTSRWSVIVGGGENCIGEIPATGSPVGACYSFIGGGRKNLIDSCPLLLSCFNIIGGGDTNCIVVNSNHVGLLGGCCNSAGGVGSFLGGGECNLSFGSYVTIGGGLCNCINGGTNVIAGGMVNEILGNADFIGAGCGNIIADNPTPACSSIVGGAANLIGSSAPGGLGFSSNCSAIVGGALNSLRGNNNFIGGGCCNVISNVTGGYTFSDFSAIVGGDLNCIDTSTASNSSFAIIGGGQQNFICAGGSFASVFGGQVNLVNGFNSSIVGGDTNCIGSSVAGTLAASYGFIGQGKGNCIDTSALLLSEFDIIGGGTGNTICAGSDDSGIFGGFANIINANCSMLVGGCSNSLGSNVAGSPFAGYSFLGGGELNCIDSSTAITHAVIGGGHQNCLAPAANHSAIFSGTLNKVVGPCSFIGSGQSNHINGSGWNVIGGGGQNCINSPGPTNVCYNVIGGGFNNCICHPGGAGQANGLLSGHQNLIRGDYSFIGGGFQNCVSEIFNVITGGLTNCIIIGSSSFIGSGVSNTIGNAAGGGVQASFIGGGIENCIDSLPGVEASYVVIGGGQGNYVAPHVLHSSILGGIGNCVCDSCSIIAGGCTNLINGAGFNAIVGGCMNQITGTNPATYTHNIIGGGCCNCISGFESGSFNGIFSGSFNEIPGTGTNSWNFIGGGEGNCACIQGNAIGGGESNCIIGYLNGILSGQGNVIGNYPNATFAFYSIIGSGISNCIDADVTDPSTYSSSNIIGSGSTNYIGTCVNASSIVGGNANILCGYASAIGGGDTNTVGSLLPASPTADLSFIGGGQYNCIDATGANTQFGIIGGGQSNCICAGTLHSGIFGGYQNCVAGNCSAILGGSGNSDGGFNNVFIAGSGITAALPNMLYANCLNANSIPFNPVGALPQGTIFALAPSALPLIPLSPTGGVLWIV